MSGNPNLDALYSIQIKFDNLKKDIDARTKLMQDINNKIYNAYRLLPYNLEATYPTSDNLDRYLPRTIETELEQMNLLCLQLESESMTENFTTEIHRILLYLESCRKSTDSIKINKDMKMIEYYAKELKKYTSAITVEHQWFQTEIKQASLLFPNGFHIDDIMKDLNNKLPEDFDKHLKNILLKSGYFSEPDKSSHIESAIAAILSELKEFRESAESQRPEPHGAQQPAQYKFTANAPINMDFFYEKSMECLKHVEHVEYTSTWKAEAFGAIRSVCRELSVELNAAKKSEISLLAWRTRLMDARSTFGGDIITYNGTVGIASAYKIAEYIQREMMTCWKLITEMLRILNPGEEKYQTWYTPGDREIFLKDIGFIGFKEGSMRDNLVQNQNMYCVNISTSHHPVSYSELLNHVSPKTMHQRERANASGTSWSPAAGISAVRSSIQVYGKCSNIGM